MAALQTAEPTHPWPVRRSRRCLLIYGALVGAVACAALGTVVIVHEVLGHLAVAYALGAQLHGFRVFQLMGGEASYTMPAESPASFGMLATAGGILANTVVGLACMFVASKTEHRRPRVSAVLLIVGSLHVARALSYVALDLYYQWGDPTQLAVSILGSDFWSMPLRNRFFWLPFLLLSPFVMYALSVPYFRLHQRWFPSANARGRCRTLAWVVVGFASVLLVFAVSTHRLLPQRERSGMFSDEHARGIQVFLSAHARVQALKAELPGITTAELRERMRAEHDRLVLRESDKPSPWYALVFFATALAGVGWAFFESPAVAVSTSDELVL